MAKLLQVTERTVYAWISGRTAVPYAAYKLLRLFRWFELPGPWDGWHMHSGKLWSPEGLGFDPSDAVWWSLLVRKASQFDAQCRLNAKLQVRVAELVARVDDLSPPVGEAPSDRGTRAHGAKPADPKEGEVLVTPHKHAKNGAEWTVEAVSRRWFNYDRGQPYRGAK